jgi:hypothetical protein
MVSPRMWMDPRMDALREKGHEGPCVISYLKTSPHSNMLGLFWQPIPYMGFETGLGEHGAAKGLQDCIDVGFCDFDSSSRMVWVFDMAAEQIGETLSPKDHRCKGVQNTYDALPENRFLGAFYDRYATAFHMTGRRGVEVDVDLFGPVPVRPLQGGSKQGEGEREGQGQGQGQGDKGASGPSGGNPTPAPPPPRADPPLPSPPPAPPAPAPTLAITPTAAGAACLALKQAGIPDVSPSHPKLVALLAAGVTNDELTDAAVAAIEAHKGNFRYVLGVVEGRRKDAAALAIQPGAPPARGHRNRQEALEDSNSRVGQAWLARNRKPETTA